MTTKEKMHTIEISEQELAIIMFSVYKVNGSASFRLWRRCRGILDKRTGSIGIEDKHNLLSKVCGYNNFIDYHTVAEEWEAFLGIGEEVNNKDILDKIISMEKELAELKRLL